MTIYYRDKLGIVAEEMSNEESGESVDFCDGFAYFTSATIDENGNLIERKIPVSAIVRINR